MHPREILATHYLVPELLAADCAVWVQGARSPGNDVRLEHELAVLDVAAGTELPAGGAATSIWRSSATPAAAACSPTTPSRRASRPSDASAARPGGAR